MRTVLRASLVTLLASGGVLLVLGVIIWTGKIDGLIGIHVGVGSLLVLDLWVIAVLAARSGVKAGVAWFAGLWGALVVALGLAQEELLPGDWHWTIQVLHLIVSMGAVALGRRLLQLVAGAGPVGAVGGARPAAVGTAPSASSGM